MQKAIQTERKRWCRVQYLAQLFWTRWKKEYLQSFQERQKCNTEKRNLKVGDLVLVTDEEQPRGSWSMGLVRKVEEDKGGLVRAATVKTKTYELHRPIHKLVMLLPADEQF